jgi:predicted metal-dependent phosphotriesterase family hydrolase
LFTSFIPALRNRGFSREDIKTLLVRNPAKAFSIARA